MNKKRIIIFKTATDELTLPITPQEYEIASSTAYDKVNIHGIGDVYAGGLESAQTIKLMSFFPANTYGFAMNADTDPRKYIAKIETLRKEKTVFQLIISDTEINLPVRVQSFLYGEADGSNDIAYQLTLCVHRGLETAETAGWTIPKRKYDKPKKTGKSKSKDNPRTNKTAHSKPKTVCGYIKTSGGYVRDRNVQEVS